MFSEWQKSVTLMGLSRAMWAPTSRTRQSKILSPGSNPDKSEDSRLTLPHSPPSAAVPETLIPPCPERCWAKGLFNWISCQLSPPFFAQFSWCSLWTCKNKSCDLFTSLDWYVMIVYDDCFDKHWTDHKMITETQSEYVILWNQILAPMVHYIIHVQIWDKQECWSVQQEACRWKLHQWRK